MILRDMATDTLAVSAPAVDFRTEPSHYRHWRLQIEGDCARLTMAVQAEGAVVDS